MVTSSATPALANDPYKRRPISEILIVLRIDGSQLRRIASLLISLLGRSRATNVPPAGANMNEATTIARTPRAAQAPNRDVLFVPYRLGPFNLRHRIVMAPLTRSRPPQPGNVPSSVAGCYYAQRASAALIVSEATQVSMQGQGYAWTP